MKRTADILIVHLRAAALLAGLCALFSGCGPEATYCAPGDASCETQCEGGCPTGQTCISDRCVNTGPTGLQCSAAGETCNPRTASSDGFLCIDWDAQGVRDAMCSEACADDGSCPSGSSCFVLSSNLDGSCQSQADCRTDMMCIQGTCRYTACQPSECAGFLDGQQACAQKYADHPDFPDGAKCYEFENQSNFCFPAGTKQRGEQCVRVDAALAQQNFQATCAAGLGCIGGTCRTACKFDDECEGDETCTFASGNELGEEVGFCASTCTPFEEGACPEGQMCEPVGPSSGHCVSTGETPAFSECVPGAHACEPGTLCVEYPTQTGPTQTGQAEARCHPVCDVSVADVSDDGGQAARDATCPQSPPALASLRIAHLTETLGPIDVYAVDQEDALVESLEFEAAFPAPSDGAWHAIEPGRYRLTAVPAGAPRSDRPLVDVTVDLVSGAGTTVFVAPPPANSSDEAQAVVVDAGEIAGRTPGSDVQVVHLVSDADRLDVIAVAAGADASVASNQQVLVQGLAFGEAASLASVLPGEIRVLAFAAGADRGDPGQALIDLSGVTLDPQTDRSLVLRGTLDPDDFYATGRPTLLPLPEDPASAALGPKFSCTALANGAYGYCQQVCTGGAEDFGQERCLGDRMGCTATDFPARDEWLTLCSPVGEKGAGASCDPARPFGECAEGLYCLQYGTGASSGVTGPLGQCTPLCEVGAEGDGAEGEGALGCEQGQSCKPVVYDGSYDIGECNWQCAPGADYADSTCPQGLQSCKPVASLQEGALGQAAPVVSQEQPYCSPSGVLSAGQPCRGLDCTPGTECMYPRSQQTDLTSTLLSQYYGATGLVPTCTPQCDPFDGDTAATQCASNETCLPNYPWSAEVGHCAVIEEELPPMQPCTKPGLSCGEDSICVLYQGGQECFRFCDYLGADSQGTYLQSTCPTGMGCEPFVQDIGRCMP